MTCAPHSTISPGLAKCLLNTVSDAPLTNLQKEDLGTVYRSGMRALTLLNGLIDIARINQHEKEPNPKDTDIEQLIAQGLAQWKKFNPGADVQLDYQVLTPEKTIHTDEQIGRQVIPVLSPMSRCIARPRPTSPLLWQTSRPGSCSLLPVQG